MTAPLSHDSTELPSPSETMATVRYSLPTLLAELQLERLTGTLAMERLSQAEISKLFKAQPKRPRAKPSR